MSISNIDKIREKFEKLKKLADAMYYAAQQLTTDASRLHKAMDEYHKFIIHECKDETVSGLDNGDMSIERWKQAVEAASNQRNYRSSKGLTETRDDYFVDGVQWADEHPKEEPVSEQNLSNVGRTGKNWKEAVSEAAEDYSKSTLVGSPYIKKNAFKAGANWQKQQDQSIIELAEDHAMLAGMEKMKEQMMKDAIKCEIAWMDGFILNYTQEQQDGLLEKIGTKVGDKVKLVIIKEE